MLSVLVGDDFRAAGTDDTEGIPEALRGVRGAEVAVLAREVPGRVAHLAARGRRRRWTCRPSPARPAAAATARRPAGPSRARWRRSAPGSSAPSRPSSTGERGRRSRRPRCGGWTSRPGRPPTTWWPPSAARSAGGSRWATPARSTPSRPASSWCWWGGPRAWRPTWWRSRRPTRPTSPWAPPRPAATPRGPIAPGGPVPDREEVEAVLPAVRGRRAPAGAGAGRGQGRRRAALPAHPPRRAGRAAGARDRDPCARAGRLRRGLRHGPACGCAAARAPTCASSPSTSASGSAAAATAPRCGAPRWGTCAVEDAVAPEDVGPAGGLEPLAALGHLPRRDLSPDEARAAGHGRPVPAPEEYEGPVALAARGRLVAVARPGDGGLLRPEVVLCRESPTRAPPRAAVARGGRMGSPTRAPPRDAVARGGPVRSYGSLGDLPARRRAPRGGHRRLRRRAPGPPGHHRPRPGAGARARGAGHGA